jgi:hypothetical protein
MMAIFVCDSYTLGRLFLISYGSYYIVNRTAVRTFNPMPRKLGAGGGLSIRGRISKLAKKAAAAGGKQAQS